VIERVFEEKGLGRGLEALIGEEEIL